VANGTLNVITSNVGVRFVVACTRSVAMFPAVAHENVTVIPPEVTVLVEPVGVCDVA
jgi:hypothetical protein